MRMIRGFACKETERVFRRERSRRFPPAIVRAIQRKLEMLNAAISIDDLRVPPSNHLEKLLGRRAGEYSIRVNAQWRLCFRWRESDAFDVQVEDYH
jgi:proteic killer suppression protein